VFWVQVECVLGSGSVFWVQVECVLGSWSASPGVAGASLQRSRCEDVSLTPGGWTHRRADGTEALQELTFEYHRFEIIYI